MIHRHRPPELHDADGRKVLVLIAAEAEYGPALRALCPAVVTGVGPVEAALSSMWAIGASIAAGKRPDCVLSIGSAGSATLHQGAIYQVSSVSYRDMDASPFGFAKGTTPFLDLPAELKLPLRLPGIPEARLSSGGGVISGEMYLQIDADMVEMETFSILRACHHYDLPLIGLRGISDGDEEVGHIDDWTKLLHIIDERLAEVIARLGPLLDQAERRG